MSFTVLIPARYASTRLPGKPLADIAGKPMVVRVAERALASGATRVVVATDDARVHDAVAAHGLLACMTRADHPTGTDRLAEAAVALGLADDEIVVNVQGDEPLLDPALMRNMAVLLEGHPDAAIATACHPIADAAEAFNPNVVKVALDAAGYALYFSRATIPWARDAFAHSKGSLPARTAAVPALRTLRVSDVVPARVSRARAGADRAFRGAGAASCACGTAFGSSSRSRAERRRRASTRPRISRACGLSMRLARQSANRLFASNDRSTILRVQQAQTPISRREPARRVACAVHPRES